MKNKSVLVVDDAAFIRNLVKNTLQKLNIGHVIEAPNGREALAILIKNSGFDLIICDLHMPEMDGMQLLSAVREDELLEKIPFLMLTSDVSQDNVKQAIAAGVTDYIVKPFKPDPFTKKIEQLLKRN